MNLNAIGIISKNIESTLAFYGLFGLVFDKLGDDHYEAKCSNGVRLMIDSEALIIKINPSWKSGSGSRIVLCHKCDSEKEVDKIHSNIVGRGYQSVKDPFDAFWGQRYSSVLDPDGNQVDIYCDK